MENRLRLILNCKSFVMSKKKEFILFVSQNINECNLETRRAVLRYIYNSAIPIQEKGVGSQVKFSQLRVEHLRHIKELIESYLSEFVK